MIRGDGGSVRIATARAVSHADHRLHTAGCHTGFHRGRHISRLLPRSSVAADLGVGSTEIVLDFNYAYNPSCAYDEHWVCPLPPSENRLPIDIEAGEQMPGGIY